VPVLLPVVDVPYVDALVHSGLKNGDSMIFCVLYLEYFCEDIFSVLCLVT
jgi:hypothetical protein